MIKCVFVVGDSFAYGSELGMDQTWYETINNSVFTDYHRRHCYSGIIAANIRAEEYINLGTPAGSNQLAYRLLIYNIPMLLKKYKPEEIFVNVSLTHAPRLEFFTPSNNDWYRYMASWPPEKSNKMYYNFWESLTKDFSNDYSFYTFDMMMQLAMQNFLIKNKIPYLLTSSMSNATDRLNITGLIPKEVKGQIYQHRYYIDPSFHSFAVERGFKIGPGFHPLEEGHKGWADHLFVHIEKNNLLDNSDL